MSRMFVPGPVDVADEVLQAQAAPMLPHRSKEFEAIFRHASEKSQQLFYTKYRVFLDGLLWHRIAGSGHPQLRPQACSFRCQRRVCGSLVRSGCINGKEVDEACL